MISKVWCICCGLSLGARVKPHFHADFHEIFLITKGRVLAHIDGITHEGEVGDLIYHPRGRTHSPEPVGDCNLQFLHLRFHGGDELLARWERNLYHDFDGRLRWFLDWLQELESGQSDENEELRSQLVTAMIQAVLLRQVEGSSRLKDKVARHVRANLKIPIRLEDLARENHMSKFHFSRRFKEETGIPPMRFVAQQRILAARQLLVHTDMTLDAVAEETGFTDAAHLSHSFKRIEGCRPGDCRRQTTAPEPLSGAA